MIKNINPVRNKQKLSNGVKTITIFFLLWVILVFLNGQLTKAAIPRNVAVSTTVQASLSFDITAGDTVPFGPLTAGVPIAAPAGGTIATVTTNAANGYTIGLSDGSATNSALAQGGVYIADYAGTIGTPTTWTGTGLGITMWDADSSPEGKWCDDVCSNYDDEDNKYAGIPETLTTAHTVTGAVVGADTSSWAFKVDVPGDQKTGLYSGNVTFTATAVLS